MPISSFRRHHERNESDTEMENVNLYPQEPLKAILKNLSQDWVNFDHFGNKLKSKAFFEIIQTSDYQTFSENLSDETIMIRQ